MKGFRKMLALAMSVGVIAPMLTGLPALAGLI